MIPETKIAVEKETVKKDYRFWENRRGLRSYDDFLIEENDPEFEYFANKDQSFFELMQLIDCLELIITPEDSEVGDNLEFTWTMVDYSLDNIDI